MFKFCHTIVNYTTAQYKLWNMDYIEERFIFKIINSLTTTHLPSKK